jgi:hypothetical protein
MPQPTATPQLVPLHTVPTPIEQEHIRQAMEASQTSMDAIQTLLSMSQWVLGVLAVLIAILALWGLRAVTRGSAQAAKQIANGRFDTYIECQEFRDLVEEKIDRAIERRWQNTIVIRTLKEDPPPAGDLSEFPEANK